MSHQRYLNFFEKSQVYLIIFACFSISLPTAFMSVSMGLLVIAWGFSGNFNKKFQLVKNNPAAIVSIVLFLMYGVGLLYSSALWEARLAWWFKYHKLLYIPLIISVLTNEKYRDIAIKAFLAGMLMILVISYLKWLGIVPHKDTGQGYFVFKGRIAHNIFMAFTMYLTLHLAVRSSDMKRWLWIAVSLLAAINILFLVNGRSGQVIMPILFMWFCWETWSWKSIRWLTMSLVATSVIYLVVNETPTGRLMEIRQEILNHQPNHSTTSSGLRLEFYVNTLTLIKNNPFFGGGTGSFVNDYRALAETQETVSNYITNPHNEFLLTGQELGIVGVLLLIAFFVVSWRLTYYLDFNDKESKCYGYALRGLILTIFVGSLFNSLLLDAGEGKFYCVLAGVFLSTYQPLKKQYP